MMNEDFQNVSGFGGTLDSFPFPGSRSVAQSFNEYLLSDGHILTLAIDAYDLQRSGKYSAGGFKTYQNREASGYAFLDFDVILLLAQFPNQIVETNRADEHFFFRLLLDGDDVIIQRWGSQGEHQINFTQREFGGIVQAIAHLPAGEQLEANDPNDAPAIISRKAEEWDRPDWCSDCSRPDAACVCMCWGCKNPRATCTCPKMAETTPVVLPDGRRVNWLGKTLRPLDFGENRLCCEYILSQTEPVFTAEVFSRYGDGDWTETCLLLHAYNGAGRIQSASLYLETLELNRAIRGQAPGEQQTSLFGRAGQSISLRWDMQGVALQESNPVFGKGTGSILLPWSIWELLLASLLEFEAYHAEQKKKRNS